MVEKLITELFYHIHKNIMLKDFKIMIKLLFLKKDKELYLKLKQILGFYPHNIELYKTALMHKSIMHRNNKGKPVNNERLEFLGDAVLDAIVGDIVYRRFPGKREGFLTNTRSKLVQRETLGKLANEMGVTNLVMSSGRSQSHNSYMGGNAFEALVGAIYLDRGYDTCMRFMKKRILDNIINVNKVAYKEVNFKSKLLEWSQKNRIKLEYKEVRQSKDENGSPMFMYKVMLETVEGETGKGYSKKESQQMASKLTLELLRKNSKYLDTVFVAKTERTKMEEEPVMSVPVVKENVEPENTDMKKENPALKRENNKPQTQEQEPEGNKPRQERKQHQERKEKQENNEKQNKHAVRNVNYVQDNTENDTVEKQEKKQERKPRPERKPKTKEPKIQKKEEKSVEIYKPEIENNDDFDLSDISAKELSREEIIALAEQAAFEEN